MQTATIYFYKSCTQIRLHSLTCIPAEYTTMATASKELIYSAMQQWAQFCLHLFVSPPEGDEKPAEQTFHSLCCSKSSIIQHSFILRNKVLHTTGRWALL